MKLNPILRIFGSNIRNWGNFVWIDEWSGFQVLKSKEQNLFIF